MVLSRIHLSTVVRKYCAKFQSLPTPIPGKTNEISARPVIALTPSLNDTYLNPSRIQYLKQLAPSTVSYSTSLFLETSYANHENPYYSTLHAQIPRHQSHSHTKHWLKSVNSLLTFDPQPDITDITPILSLYAQFALINPTMYAEFKLDLESLLVLRWWEFARNELYSAFDRSLCMILVAHSVLDIRISQENWKLWCVIAGQARTWRNEYIARVFDAACRLEMKLESEILRKFCGIFFLKLDEDMSAELFSQYLTSGRKLGMRFLPKSEHKTQLYLATAREEDKRVFVLHFVKILNELKYWRCETIDDAVYKRWCRLFEECFESEFFTIQVLSLAVKLWSQFGCTLGNAVLEKISRRFESEFKLLVRNKSGIQCCVLADFVVGFGNLKYAVSDELFEVWSTLFAKAVCRMSVNELVECIDGVVKLNRTLSHQNMQLWLDRFEKRMFMCNSSTLCHALECIQKLNGECPPQFTKECARLLVHKNAPRLPSDALYSLHTPNLFESSAKS